MRELKKIIMNMKSIHNISTIKSIENYKSGTWTKNFSKLNFVKKNNYDCYNIYNSRGFVVDFNIFYNGFSEIPETYKYDMLIKPLSGDLTHYFFSNDYLHQKNNVCEKIASVIMSANDEEKYLFENNEVLSVYALTFFEKKEFQDK